MLIQHLPNQQENRHLFERLKISTDKDEEYLSAAFAGIVLGGELECEATARRKPPARGADEVEIKARLAFAGIPKDFNSTLEATRKLFATLRAEVAKERAVVDRRASYAWLAAAWLYTAGWALAVVGRLYGLSMGSD